MHVTLVTFNRINSSDGHGRPANKTANYFSRFNHVISKLPGHGHDRPSKTVKSIWSRTVRAGRGITADRLFLPAFGCWPRRS